MSTKFASRTSQATFTASGSGGEMTVASGNAVQVCGILFTAVTAAIFTVTNDGTTVKFLVNVAANTSRQVSIPFLADDGLRIQTDQTDGSVVVFHNSPGV